MSLTVSSTVTSENKKSQFPEGWEPRQMGDLFEIQQGKSLSPKSRKCISPSPFLRTANVLWGELKLDVIDQMDFSEVEIQKLALRRDDLLVCEGGAIGRTAIWQEEIPLCLYQNHLHRLRPKEAGVIPRFYMYWMDAGIRLLKLYEGTGNRTTIPNLSRSRLSAYAVPKPEEFEQLNIAKILDAINAGIRIQENVIGKTKELKKSLIQKLLTEGVNGLDKAKWQSVKLDKIFKLTSGKTRPGDIRSAAEETYCYPIYGGNGILGYAKECFLTEDTIVLGRVGAYCGAVHVSRGQSWISDNALYAKEFLEDVNLTYLASALEFLDLNRLKNRGGQPLISQSIVYSQSILLPDHNDQKQIAEMIELIDTKIRIEETRSCQLIELFQSMLLDLMTGQARVKDLEVKK
jgi:type I restriction enzyme, S subunit